jgi:hypothetical protein
MIRMSLLALAVVVAACGATNPRPTVATGEQCSRWDGQSCTRDTQCCSLWCVNDACARREP